jgi:electron transport complex protein RnfA
MGLAVILVMFAASVVSWTIFYQLLVPFNIIYMRTVIFILVIASLVQILEITIRRTNVHLYNALGIYLPLITTNCAVLGVTFINVDQAFNLFETIASAFGAGIGFTIVLAIMSGMRERLELADIPESFKGIPVAFLIAMLLGIAFIAFGGMV